MDLGVNWSTGSPNSNREPGDSILTANSRQGGSRVLRATGVPFKILKWNAPWMTDSQHSQHSQHSQLHNPASIAVCHGHDHRRRQVRSIDRFVMSAS